LASVAIALGSNIGDRKAHLTWAIEQLKPHLSRIRISSFIDTDPVGVSGPQDTYLNAAITGKTTLEPEALLGVLLGLERARGRERPSLRAPRTLDLDLIFYDSRTINVPGLVVPHPRFMERRFVLEPLAEIAPGWKDPVTGKAVKELLAELAGS
jgi:2-amino-4-hydroxy-6-hydroxymethyldihydropteridine diphosphokinase